MNVVFLDIDGVLNHQHSDDREYSLQERFGLAEDLVKNLKKIIDEVADVKIVISSSWRVFKKDEIHVSKDKEWREVLCNMLGCSQDVIDSDIPFVNEFVTGGAYARARDIQLWLEANAHRGIGTYVIIDDECSALKKLFFNNVVDCDIVTSQGLTEARAKEAIWILNSYGREKKMNAKTFFVSDTHFSHENIIKYCNRPFSSVEDMDEQLIARWNAKVGKDDIVWHLGDFSFGSKDNVKKHLSRLNGKINLVMGNHDRMPIKFYYDAGFNRVYDHPVLLNNFVILSHAPLEWVKPPMFNIFGHVHDVETYKTATASSFCACVERWDYSPVSWTIIEAKAKNA